MSEENPKRRKSDQKDVSTIALWSVLLGLLVAAFSLFDDLHEGYLEKKDQKIIYQKHLLENHANDCNN